MCVGTLPGLRQTSDKQHLSLLCKYPQPVSGPWLLASFGGLVQLYPLAWAFQLVIFSPQDATFGLCIGLVCSLPIGELSRFCPQPQRS